jgi:hypothetical protein
VGGVHLNYFVYQQLPVLAPSMYDPPAPWSQHQGIADWIADRVVELVYTAWDMQPFARDYGDDGAPFVWDGERRAVLRAELDAAYFHLYGLDRDEVGHILDTFPIVRRKDETVHGEYRTRRLVLENYDEMASAMRTGTSYQTSLDPAPGGRRHVEREEEPR